MIKDKQLIVWKLQKKVDSYFNNKTRYPKHDIYQSACKTVIWLMVEKGYAKQTACKCVGAKRGVSPGTIANILEKYILSKRHMKRHRKMCQSKFFSKLKRVSKIRASQ